MFTSSSVLKWKIFGIVSFIIMLVFVAYFVLWGRYPRTITVLGTGTQTVVAQKARITFALSINENTQAAAYATGEAVMNTILTSLGSYNLSSVTKTASQVAPYTNQVTNNIDGYRYVSAAQFTVIQLQNMDAILKLLNNQGAIVSSVIYLPEDEDTTNSQARALAIQDATKQAQQMAAAAHAHIGKVITISDQTSQSANGAISNTQGGQLNQANSFSNVQSQANVAVTFELW